MGAAAAPLPLVAELAIGFPLKHSAVNYVVTAPGPAGPSVAFVAELLISGMLISMMLTLALPRH